MRERVARSLPHFPTSVLPHTCAQDIAQSVLLVVRMSQNAVPEEIVVRCVSVWGGDAEQQREGVRRLHPSQPAPLTTRPAHSPPPFHPSLPNSTTIPIEGSPAP